MDFKPPKGKWEDSYVFIHMPPITEEEALQSKDEGDLLRSRSKSPLRDGGDSLNRRPPTSSETVTKRIPTSTGRSQSPFKGGKTIITSKSPTKKADTTMDRSITHEEKTKGTFYKTLPETVNYGRS